MTPRALAQIAAPRMRAEFDRVFAEHEAEFDPNYDRHELRMYVLDLVTGAMWKTTQGGGVRRNEHGDST
jgi:hypothetical protein